MAVLTSFLWYLLAFALGSLLTFFVLARMIPATSEREAFADLDHAGYGPEYDVDDRDDDRDDDEESAR